MERAYNKIYYYFLAIIPFMVVGFFHTFFGKNATFYVIPTIVQMHIVALLLWCILFALQVYFAIKGNLDAHRSAGKISYILVPIIVVTTLIAAKNNYLHHPADMEKALAVKTLYHSYIGSLTFFLFYTMAIIKKNNRPIHLRYMICTTTTFLGAAVYRINYRFLKFEFLNSLHFGSLISVFTVVDLVFISLIIYDKVNGKSYWPYWVALIACFTEQVLYFSFTHSRVWMWVVNLY